MHRLTFLFIVLCGTAAAAPAHRTTVPEPLTPRNFVPPTSQTAPLSNGIPVTVVENHEVPLVWVQIAFNRGGWTSPDEMPLLANVTMDMLNEGAGDLDAAGISNATRRIATHLSTWSGADDAGVSIRSLTNRVEESLDLLTLVLHKPTFPSADWELMRKKKLADLASARSNPRSIQNRVWLKQFYGDSYRGRLGMEAGYNAITVDHMRQWWTDHIQPNTARIFVGGDTTLEAIQPLLEERLGRWTGQAIPAQAPSETLDNAKTTRIVLVDKPGATQSVVQAGYRTRAITDPGYSAANLANMSFGGMFSARLNLNLREEKGWTYGARSGLKQSLLPLIFSAGASVKTDTTADTIREILRELKESQDDRPFTQEELDNVRGYLLGTHPLRFESPNYLLNKLKDMWIYDLPADWVSGYSERVRSVTLPDAQAAWNSWIDPGRLLIVVVGDAATIRSGLDSLDLPIAVVDADGNPVGE